MTRWTIPVLLKALILLVGCGGVGPQRLVLTDSLTGEPVSGALVVMAFRAVEDVSEDDWPLGVARRRQAYWKWRKERIEHGSLPRPKKHTFGPGMYYNPEALAAMPVAPTDPVRIEVRRISTGWEIVTERDPVNERVDPSFLVTRYLFVKDRCLPRLMSGREMSVLARRDGRVYLALRAERPGEQGSDETVLHAAGKFLELCKGDSLWENRTLRRDVLVVLAGALQRIVDFPADPLPYEAFVDHRDRARRLLDRIGQLDPAALPGQATRRATASGLPLQSSQRNSQTISPKGCFDVD